MIRKSLGGSEEDLRRWEAWLCQSFPPNRLARVRYLPGLLVGEAVWYVEHRSGKHGWIYISPDALGLSGEQFTRLTERLSVFDWYPQLDRWVRIRIDGGGTVAVVR